MKNYSRLRQFIGDFTRLIERAGNEEAAIFEHDRKLLKSLVVYSARSLPNFRDRPADVRATLTV
jgi:hypothetical protein